jgi:predicted DCC family thiol-disulfide oxidoreductase YuxK
MIEVPVLFDGDCGVCAMVVTWLKARTSVEFSYVAYQDFSEAELSACGLSASRCGNSIQAYCKKQRRFLEGHEAFALLLSSSRGMPKALGDILGVRLLNPLLKLGYGIFARNRTTISKILGLNQCRVPTR